MKNNQIRINEDGNGVVTKAFQKQAMIFGTPEYEAWKAFTQDYPKAAMITKSIKRNPDKKTNKNLTYENMEKFIKAQADAEALMATFAEIKERSSLQTSPYHWVLSWFLHSFPDYKSFDSSSGEAKAEITELQRAAS